MKTFEPGKLQKLMESTDKQVLTASWLTKHGYSHQLVKSYTDRGWLTPVARGAFVKNTDTFTWDGGLHAIQQQMKLPIHLGGRSALKCHGIYHYVRTHFDLLLCATVRTHMPHWFIKACEGQYPYHGVNYTWLDGPKLGLVQYKGPANFEVTIAGKERAMLELLSLVPQFYGYDEASYLMESMPEVDVKLAQAILESSTHVKANRLFLHLADECEHPWLGELNIEKIALGSGNRVLPGATRCAPTYKLYVPDTPLNEGWSKQHRVI